jgi:uncharacterized membrane protein
LYLYNNALEREKVVAYESDAHFSVILFEVERKNSLRIERKNCLKIYLNKNQIFIFSIGLIVYALKT